MVMALGFLVAAVAATLLPDGARRGIWLPLHLALAGSATTAIAGVMPFFSAAIAAAPPSDVRLRFAAVGSVGVGAAGVSFGVVASLTGVAAASGFLFIVGLGLVGVATVRPLGNALGPSRGVVTRGYVAALGSVAVGASLATLFLLGWPPVVEVWTRLRVAHAWLNIVGFVTLVIATTLLHFFPTVVGARIAGHRSARVAVAGLAVGPLLAAGGVLLAIDALAWLGAAVALVGAGGLTRYAWRIWGTRARWTTDPGWHAFVMGGLVSAICWLDVGLLVAAGRVLLLGADPGGWSTASVAGPLVAGWIGLTIIASISHLVPAVGPGGSAAHARQRRILGRGAFVRLALMNAGVAGLSVGLWFDAPVLVGTGILIGAIGFAGTAGLILSAVGIGLGRPEPHP